MDNKNSFSRSILDEEKIIKSIRYLSDHCHLNISDLDPTSSLYSSYMFVKSYPNLDQALQIIQQQYRPTSLSFNTIGTFLFGGLQNHYGEIDSTSSPFYIQSLSYDPTTFHKYQIWIHSNSDYIPLISTSQSQAYVFVHSDFTSFHQSHLDNFSQANIKTVQLISTSKLKHHLLTSPLSLHSLPLHSPKNTYHSSSSSLRSSISPLFLIFFILFLGLILLYLSH
jgi:hypothetical protein